MNDLVWVAVIGAGVAVAFILDRYERAADRRARRLEEQDSQQRLLAELDRQEDGL
jgi:hypothetical protein